MYLLWVDFETGAYCCRRVLRCPGTVIEPPAAANARPCSSPRGPMQAMPGRRQADAGDAWPPKKCHKGTPRMRCAISGRRGAMSAGRRRDRVHAACDRGKAPEHSGPRWPAHALHCHRCAGSSGNSRQGLRGCSRRQEGAVGPGVAGHLNPAHHPAFEARADLKSPHGAKRGKASVVGGRPDGERRRKHSNDIRSMSLMATAPPAVSMPPPA